MVECGDFVVVWVVVKNMPRFLDLFLDVVA